MTSGCSSATIDTTCCAGPTDLPRAQSKVE
jgi:hypothetical protein